MADKLIEGARNFRDLGGYRTTAGEVVRCGRVFRSAHLANLTDGDLETFTKLGIRTVVDFRPEVEKDLTGHNRLPEGVRYLTLYFRLNVGIDICTPLDTSLFQHPDIFLELQNSILLFCQYFLQPVLGLSKFFFFSFQEPLLPFHQ